MNPSRVFLKQLLLAIVLVLIPNAAGFAQGNPAAPPRVVLTGHDPVAYFTDGRPVKGSPQFSVDWDEGRYHFASARHRDMFAAEPDRYAPRFDGYCTGSMAKAVRLEGDPEAWIIVDGRLYVFGQVKFRDIAAKDREGLKVQIAAANTNWREKK